MRLEHTVWKSTLFSSDESVVQREHLYEFRYFLLRKFDLVLWNFLIDVLLNIMEL